MGRAEPRARAWCLFRSEGLSFAVGLEAVAEVVEADRTVRLPLCPSRVLGLCTVRRDVVPVVSLSGHRDGGPREPGKKLNVLILRTARGLWGVRIDEGGTIVAEATLDDPETPPNEGWPAILGSIRRDGATYAVVDPELAWRDAREDIEGHYTSVSRPSDPTFENPEGARGYPLVGEHSRGES